MMDCRTVAPSPPSGTPANRGMPIDGTSRLSVLPLVSNALNNAIPESFSRNLELLSTFVWCCSSTLAFNMSQSSCEICAVCGTSVDVRPPGATLACPFAPGCDAPVPPSMRFSTSPSMARNCSISVRDCASSLCVCSSDRVKTSILPLRSWLPGVALAGALCAKPLPQSTNPSTRYRAVTWALRQGGIIAPPTTADPAARLAATAILQRHLPRDQVSLRPHVQ